jgi:hypothetical protein
VLKSFRRMTSRDWSGSWHTLRTEVVRVREAPGSRSVAVRAGLSVLIALLVLSSVDHLDWALYATFGAFASVYGGPVRSALRWRLQVALGLLLTAAVGCGTLVALSPDRRWIAVPICALWAGLAAALSDRYAWRPPGPMFAVFAVAACASVPVPVRDVAAAMGVAAATATLAVALGALEAWWAPQARIGDPSTVYHPPHRQRIQIIRCSAAVLVAGTIATASGIGHPYWAMVAAVVPLAAHTYIGQVTRGVHRVLGTAIGLLVAAVLLQIPLPIVVAVLVASGLQGTAEVLVARNYGAALIAITPLALLLGQLADRQPVGRLLVDRSLETTIGVAVGLLAVVVTREHRGPGPVPQTDR